MRKLALPAFFRTACALLVVLALCSQASAVVLDRIVALVNNEAITWLELYEAMESELAPRLKGLSPEERKKTLASSEAGFLDSMVLRRLQLQEAAKQDIFVSEDEVEMTIESIRTKYGLGTEEFRKAVEESGADWPQYTQNLREQIIIQKLVDKVVNPRVQTPQKEASAQEVKYHLKQIFIKGDRDEDELLGMVQSVYDALESGSEFETVALRMSEGPNAATGGDLGVVEESSLSRPMRQALAGVSSGQVAPPVKSGMGVHIIKVESRTSAGGQDSDTLFQEAFEHWLKELRDSARVEIRL